MFDSLEKKISYPFALVIALLPFSSQAFKEAVFPPRPDLISNNQIRDLMILESLSQGCCPCPYSENSLGGQCGTESAYYKPGGFKVYCYRYDITSEEVQFYRLKKAKECFSEFAEEEAVEVPDAVIVTEKKKTRATKEREVVVLEQPEPSPTANYFQNNAPQYQNRSPYSLQSYGASSYAAPSPYPAPSLYNPYLSPSNVLYNTPR